MMTPAEHLAQSTFRIEQIVGLLDRPFGLVLDGHWGVDLSCEGFIRLQALAPLDYVRIAAGWVYARGQPLLVTRANDPTDPRDDQGVLEAFFSMPLDRILAAVFSPLSDRLAEAAEIRKETGADAELPDRFTAGELLRHKWVN